MEPEKWLIWHENGGYLDAKQSVSDVKCIYESSHSVFHFIIMMDLEPNDWKLHHRHHHHRDFPPHRTSDDLQLRWSQMMTFYFVFKGYFWRMRPCLRLSTAVLLHSKPHRFSFFFPSVAICSGSLFCCTHNSISCHQTALFSLIILTWNASSTQRQQILHFVFNVICLCSGGSC